MKTFLLTWFLFLSAATLGRGDELLKNVQTELKSQGFFYSEVTGVNGPETVAAIKRFQIRNGLEVTGTLTKETLGSLGLAGGAPALEAPRKGAGSPPAPATSAPRREETGRVNPPIHLRRNETAQDTDREFLRKQQPAASSGPEEENSPPAAASGGAEYSQVFARTPYAIAPLEVQQSTLLKAQRFLSERGFFQEAVADGNPGPGTEEAILGFQRSVRLPLSGRLDMQTLSAMRLLPGGKGGPSLRRPGGARPGNQGSNRVYRGVWVE